MNPDYNNIILQDISPSWLPADIQAAVLRLDLLHPEVSGNKWFKLKYNLEAAGTRPIVTFGGAYSNHIAATAAACALSGIPCTGIIRGERPAVLSHTLQQAAGKGMQLEFVSREAYRQKSTVNYPDAYVIPEGGNNEAGIRGCKEILTLRDTSRFTHILCACGTGTTLAGLITSALPHQQVYGYVVLKGAEYLEDELPKGNNRQLVHDYHCGGYAKTTPALLEFINRFYREDKHYWYK